MEPITGCPVRIGVIGCGQIAQKHFENYTDIAGVDIVACTDNNPDAAAKSAARWNIPHVYNDVREMLRRDDLDAVDVCLHNNLHASATIAALEAGCHVYCEKPIAGTYHDGVIMRDRARETGKYLHIQLDMLFARETRAAKALIDAGRLGEIYHGRSLGHRMETIARGVDNPAYGVLLHIGHWECGDPDDGDARMVSYTMHTHVDANTTHKRLDEKITLLMDGGYTGAWGVEHHSGRNEYAEIGAQLALVRRAVTRYAANAREQKQTRLERGKSHNPFLTLEQEGRA